MTTVGYVRVSTDKQAERGISLEAQAEKIRAMALVRRRTGRDHRRERRVRQEPEPARHGKRLAMVEEGKAKAVIVAKLDRLTPSVKDLCWSASSAAAWRWYRWPSRSIPAPPPGGWC
jgi:DNA invertase Pin-like site-specific DNA recombinase